MGGSTIAAVLPPERRAKLPDVVPGKFSTDEAVNSYTDVTTYNNYYEFGTDKGDPFENSQEFETMPWTVRVAGHCEKTGIFDLDDFIQPYARGAHLPFASSKPGHGVPGLVPLADIVKRHRPLSNAKHVARDLLDPERMPGQRSCTHWPYVEGLTIAEAVNPLSRSPSASKAKSCRTRTGQSPSC
jgi:sulfoxide reductase catalytic subunit YedY